MKPGPDTDATHAAVVQVGKPDDPHSIAWSAAQASLDLLRRIKVPQDYALTIRTVSIVEPIGTDDPLDMFLTALRDRPGAKQAVVVTAQLRVNVSAATAPTSTDRSAA